MDVGTRRLLSDAVNRGCRVTILPDGTIQIDPPGQERATVTAADLIDWKKFR